MKKKIEYINAKTNKGLVRPENEDAIFFNGDEKLIILADGMGGHNAGEVASNMAVSFLQECLMKTIDLKRFPNFLSDKIKEINKAIFEKAIFDEDCYGMGTTLVVFKVINDSLFFSHLGDSRLYRINNNKIEQLTKDHSLAQEYLDIGVLNKETIKSFQYKNIITKALGIDLNVVITVDCCEVNNNDLFLCCSDGLSDLVTDEEILSICLQNKNINNLCDELIKKANDNGGFDNISVGVLKIKN